MLTPTELRLKCGGSHNRVVLLRGAGRQGQAGRRRARARAAMCAGVGAVGVVRGGRRCEEGGGEKTPGMPRASPTHPPV